jgi:hypothetical protein
MHAVMGLASSAWIKLTHVPMFSANVAGNWALISLSDRNESRPKPVSRRVLVHPAMHLVPL